MTPCSICIEELKRPVALPCGHVFCTDCVYRAVNSIKPYATLHYCPTCRSPYTTLNPDSSLIPNHLRPHVLPHLRRLYLDEPNTQAKMTPPIEAATENARLTADNASLQFNCDLWRKRAEVHAAATLGLLNIARVARDHALSLKQEKEELERKYYALKRKMDATETFSDFSSGPPSSATSSTNTTPENVCPPPRTRRSIGSPYSRPRPSSHIRVSTASNHAQSMVCSAWTDIAKNIKQEDIAQPLPKRRRTDSFKPPQSSAYHLVPLHNIESDVLIPSLSRRRTPSPTLPTS